MNCNSQDTTRKLQTISDYGIYGFILLVISVQKFYVICGAVGWNVLHRLVTTSPSDGPFTWPPVVSRESSLQTATMP
ncbi:hypothetical protein XENTR_v10011987 [Xenopus tropicalis]|nr:hypothetical protein XENTR_v10011987 [Xenopus tropicalis]